MLHKIKDAVTWGEVDAATVEHLLKKRGELSGKDRIAFCYIIFRVFSEILADRLRITSEELVQAKNEIAKLKDQDKLL